MAKRRWFERCPDLVEEIRGTLNAGYPELRLILGPDEVVVRGSIPVRDASGVFDRFRVLIAFPENYPNRVPSVIETAGRIPWTPDRHVDRLSGNACLAVPGEWELVRPDRSFRTFLEGPVHSFFLGQARVEAGGDWPSGERAHGLEGLISAYAEFLAIEPESASVYRHLACLAADKPKGHWVCPCGSGRRLRKCCQGQIQALHNSIPPEVAQIMHQALKRFSGQHDQRAAGQRALDTRRT